MGTVGTVLSTAAGVAMIGLALRDAFDALFHPEGRGTFDYFRATARQAPDSRLTLSLVKITIPAGCCGPSLAGWHPRREHPHAPSGSS